jgi:endonuclease-3
VGRKIANLLLGDVFGINAIVADTHCIRICGRLGFYPETLKDPTKVEKILSEAIPENEQTDLCHRLVEFGREICRAQSPKCDVCPISQLCARKTALPFSMKSDSVG